MLNSDFKKLHFLGIDLHSRGRRRRLVALTFSIFLLSMAVLVEETKRVPGSSERSQRLLVNFDGRDSISDLLHFSRGRAG